MRKTLRPTAEIKKSLRENALGIRDAMPGDMRRAKSRAVKDRLFGLDLIREAGSVLFYASFRTEVDTEDMIEDAIASGKEVLLPKVDAENCALSKHVIKGMHEVAPGYMGIPEPSSDFCVRVEDIEVLVIPGVVFDMEGWRIGYGGGYYDRLLPRVKGTRPIIALAFEEQLVESLPHEEHDIAMDIIITDRRVIYCNG